MSEDFIGAVADVKSSESRERSSRDSEIVPIDIVEQLIHLIKTNTPVSFSKYGDGEYHCAISDKGQNCDYDKYTDKLKDGLIASFKYMIDENNSENTLIGMWHTEDKCRFWQSLVENKQKIRWVNYHTLIIDINDDFRNAHINNSLKNKIALYQSIQDSSLKKFVVCNPLMLKMRLLFKADEMIHVPFQNWFDDHFDDVLHQLKNKIGDNPQPMVLTACGMSAKILIAELHKTYPNGIFLDIGSAMDLLCTKHDSRGRLYPYQVIYEVFKHMLPEEWNHSTWETLYTEAVYKTGLHMK